MHEDVGGSFAAEVTLLLAVVSSTDRSGACTLEGDNCSAPTCSEEAVDGMGGEGIFAPATTSRSLDCVELSESVDVACSSPDLFVPLFVSSILRLFGLEVGLP